MSDDFQNMQNRAIAQLRELQAQAAPQPEPERSASAAPSPPPVSPPLQSAPPRRTGGVFSRILHMSDDMALILPLLLLLGREGADDGLLLALLYIMT